MFMIPLGTWIYGIWALILFPGADLPTTVLVSEVIALIVGSFYTLFSAAMPRSGGDYIWTSRILHPAIGFAMNFFLAIEFTMVGGSTMFWVTQYSLGPMFQVLGINSVAQFLNSPGGTFAVAAILYALFGILVTRGAKATHVVLTILFAFTVLAILAYNGVLLSLGQAGFKANFNAVSGMNYDQVLQAGAAAGYPSTYVLGSTMLAVMFTYLSFIGFNSTVYYAAEIKDVRRSQFIAILGATVIYMFILWINYSVTVSTMGSQFVGSMAYLFGTGNSAYTLSFPPFFQNLFRFATVGNPLAYSIVAIGFAATSIAGVLTYVFGSTRMIFAWAFDRVVPMSFAKVDSKYHSPYMAIILVTISSIVAMVLWVYTNVLGYFLYATFGWMIIQAFTAISGILFPWRRKDIFDSSPEIVRKRVAGVPLITLLGIAALICTIFIGYASVAPAYQGTFQPGYMVFCILIMIIGAVIYGISWFYRKRTGLPLDLTFKEIPPE
jgi:amino acid transporter